MDIVNINDKIFWTIPECAWVLRISEDKLYRMCSADVPETQRIPCKRIGTRIIFFPKRVFEWVEKQSVVVGAPSRKKK